MYEQLVRLSARLYLWQIYHARLQVGIFGVSHLLLHFTQFVLSTLHSYFKTLYISVRGASKMVAAGLYTPQIEIKKNTSCRHDIIRFT